MSENEERLTIHNYYLLMLVEQGVIGFLIFVGLLIAILLKCEKLYHRFQDSHYKSIVMGIAVFMVIMMVNLLLSDLVEAVKPGALFLLMIAFLVNLDHRQKELDKSAS